MKLFFAILTCMLALPLMVAASPAASAETAQALKTGQTTPQVSLLTPEGEAFDLGAAVREQPTVLIFYRGGWCPYCIRHLAALQEIEEDLLGMGFQIIAVSPDTPAGLQPTVQKNELNYQLLSDREMKAASSYGVAFIVPDDIRTKYEDYGIDLASVPGNPDAKWLPVPAIFLIDAEGVVRFVHTNPNYKVRMDPADILDAAEDIVGSSD
jgi:peroxiredoxin